MRQQEELLRNSRANKTFGYSGLLSSALDRKTETDQNGKRKLNVVMQVLQEVFVRSPEIKDFINEKLEQKGENEIYL